MEQLKAGALLALAREDARAVFEAARTQTVMESARELIDRLDGTDRLQSVGSYWSLLHTALVRVNGDSEEVSFILSQCLLGGRALGGAEAVVMFVRPDLVLHVVRELESLDKDLFLSAWDQVLADAATEFANLEAEVPPWQRVEQIRSIYGVAGQRGEAVLFVAISRESG